LCSSAASSFVSWADTHPDNTPPFPQPSLSTDMRADMKDIDQEWRPKGRPQSIIAQNFSIALDSIFGLDDGTEELAQSVEQKKKDVSSRSAELEALQARLRATEQRLKESQSQSASPSGGSSRYNSPQRKALAGSLLSSSRSAQSAAPTSPLATQPASTQSHPPTASSSYRPSSKSGNAAKERQQNENNESDEDEEDSGNERR